MSGAQPTPGPWGIEVTSDACWIGPMRAAGDKVAGVVVRVDTDREYKMEVLAEKKANARLIAAAPTMRDYIARKADEGDAEAIQILEAIDAHS